MTEPTHPELRRHFGLVQATALNITMIVGAGVFVTIPDMLRALPGPYAVLGWLVAGVLILVDGLIWSELGAMFPGSGGSYLYLLESFGKERYGRLMAFLFIWQFLLSGPLELASGLIAMSQFAQHFIPILDHQWPGFAAWYTAYSRDIVLGSWGSSTEVKPLKLSLSPATGLALGAGVLIIILLYRRITTLGRLTVTLWIGVLGVLGWIVIEGCLHFDPEVVFNFTAADRPADVARGLGAAMTLALYSYLGYYTVCYVGDEVREPGRTIPRSILLSTAIVVVLFTAVHLSFLSVIPWSEAREVKNLPADFMARLHGAWAANLVTVLLMWSCFGAAFAGLLSYARIPYGAAHYGHFFSRFGAVHPRLGIPHISLLALGGMVLFWTMFDLGDVINALIITRILEQFVAQIIGVMVLRHTQPARPRPFRIWLYPLPCLLALSGWLFVYATADMKFLALGLMTLVAGVLAFFVWSWQSRAWPFQRASA